jgi:hypothetical protein
MADAAPNSSAVIFPHVVAAWAFPGRMGFEMSFTMVPYVFKDLTQTKTRWPFGFDIPMHPDPSFLRSHPLGKASYLPLPYASLNALPSSFDLVNNTAGSCLGFAVVEYYLEATMTTPDASKLVMARLPVQLRCESLLSR